MFAECSNLSNSSKICEDYRIKIKSQLDRNNDNSHTNFPETNSLQENNFLMMKLLIK